MTVQIIISQLAAVCKAAKGQVRDFPALPWGRRAVQCFVFIKMGFVLNSDLQMHPRAAGLVVSETCSLTQE